MLPTWLSRYQGASARGLDTTQNESATNSRHRLAAAERSTIAGIEGAYELTIVTVLVVEDWIGCVRNGHSWGCVLPRRMHNRGATKRQFL